MNPINEGFEKWVSVLSSAGMDVALIGSLRGKDLDVVVVGQGEGAQCAVQNLHTFISLAADSIGCIEQRTIITKQDHCGYVPTNVPVLHLLFYPTIRHLSFWELPSFTANLYETGRFLAGGRERYADLAERYRKNQEQIRASCPEVHLRAYGATATSGAVYLSELPTLIPKRLITRLFWYALRFTLVELLRDHLHLRWSPDFLAQAISGIYPNQRGLIHILRSPDVIDMTTRDRLSEWHCDLFSLTEIGRTLLRDQPLFRTRESL